jgi:hypothetical protein
MNLEDDGRASFPVLDERAGARGEAARGRRGLPPRREPPGEEERSPPAKASLTCLALRGVFSSGGIVDHAESRNELWKESENHDRLLAPKSKFSRRPATLSLPGIIAFACVHGSPARPPTLLAPEVVEVRCAELLAARLAAGPRDSILIHRMLVFRFSVFLQSSSRRKENPEKKNHQADRRPSPRSRATPAVTVPTR